MEGQLGTAADRLLTRSGRSRGRIFSDEAGNVCEERPDGRVAFLATPSMDAPERARHVRTGLSRSVRLSDEDLARAREESARRDRLAVAMATQRYVETVAGWVRDAEEGSYDRAKAAYDREASKFARCGLESPFPDEAPAPREPDALKAAPPAARSAAAEKCAQLERRASTGWYLYGGTGTGKTTMARLVLRDWISDGWSGELVREDDLCDKVRATFGGAGDEAEVVGPYERTGLLVLDDVGVQQPSAWTVRLLFAIVDYRATRGLPMIITSNYGLDQLQGRLSAVDPTRAATIVSRIRSACLTVYTGIEDKRPKAADRRRGKDAS